MFGIFVGKLAAFVLRRLGKSATSFPGKIALRVSPKILAKLGRQLDTCIVITGTNGKTTTSNLLAGILQTEGPIVHNTEGSNMRQGIVAALLQHTTWFGRLKHKTALLEIDEATLPTVSHLLPIQVAVVTNVFRDQLDRYGELDTTLAKILEGLKQTKATLILNADDPLAHFIGREAGRPVQYFGLTEFPRDSHRETQTRDGAFCLSCGAELIYEGFVYGQLGDYYCPSCEFARPTPDVQGESTGSHLYIHRASAEVSHAAQAAHGTHQAQAAQETHEAEAPQAAQEIHEAHEPLETQHTQFPMPVRGTYNVYNVLAAVSAALQMGVSHEAITAGLRLYRAPRGRMQVFQSAAPGLPSFVLNLIKNPTGCDSVLQAVLNESGSKVLCIAINDLAADGRDVSWLWDADFEQIPDARGVAMCITSGMRAEDMALRLKYAGVPPERILTEPDLNEAIRITHSMAQEHASDNVYVFTTYTALRPMADILEEGVMRHGQAFAHRPSVS